jgi:bestrophin, other
MGLFYSLHFLHQYGLDDKNRKIFEKIVMYCDRYISIIPLSFVLGFYVSNVMGRYFTQYNTIPWPTGIAVYVSSTIHGYDEVGRAMRRTIMRYTCLSLTMVFRVLSPQVQKRFPTMTSLIDAGLLNESEMKIIEDLEVKYPGTSKNFLPIVWAASIVTKARQQGRIYDDLAVKTLIKSLNNFRGSCGVLMAYNSISIPLVYTQVVTIATYSYFLTMVMAQQVTKSGPDESNMIFPAIFVMLFIFNMGWLKVAEALLNPFGDDDDDFDLNFMIDKNLTTSYLIVDDMHNEHPELVKDQYWDSIITNPNALGKNFDEQDFIDFEDSPTRRSRLSLRRRLTVPSTPSTDVEKNTTDKNQIKRKSETDLIPRDDVIDPKYKKKGNVNKVIEAQFELQKNMEKHRRSRTSKVSFFDDEPTKSENVKKSK